MRHLLVELASCDPLDLGRCSHFPVSSGRQICGCLWPHTQGPPITQGPGSCILSPLPYSFIDPFIYLTKDCLYKGIRHSTGSRKCLNKLTTVGAEQLLNSEGVLCVLMQRERQDVL